MTDNHFLTLAHPRERWFILIVIILTTLLEVLDMTIVNVALPSIMTNLGVSLAKIDWVISAYIVMSAILMPISGLFIEIVGEKRQLIICIVGFGLFSLLCGLSTNYLELVLCRAGQGLCGASLIPLAQLLLSQLFKGKEYNFSICLWGICIIAFPIAGLLLGAEITSHLGWQWIFFLNLPLCFIALWLALRYIPSIPGKMKYIDWFGFAVLALVTSSLQLMLDRGQNLGWLNSPFFRILLAIFIIMLLLFVSRGLILKKKNIIDFKIFAERNFSLGCFLLLILGTGVLGISAIQPLILQNLFSYSVTDSALVLIPGSLLCACCVGLSMLLQPVLGARALVIIGFTFCFTGNIFLAHLDLSADFNTVVLGDILRNVGMGIFFLPLFRFTFFYLSAEMMVYATGIFNFFRNIGLSFGIAISQVILFRIKQMQTQALSQQVNVFNPNMFWWTHTQHVQQHLTNTNPLTLAIINGQIARQSLFNAYLYTNQWIALVFILAMLLVWLLKPINNNSTLTDMVL